MRVADLIGLIKQKQGEIGSSLVQGYAINFETYQRLVGQHQGLDEALNIINLLLEEENKDVE
jgi:hypothetical protein